MKKNIRKTMSAGALGALLLTAGWSMPVQAADNDVVTVLAGAAEDPLKDNLIEYSEIETLVRYYNDTVLSNRYTYRNLQDMYEDADDDDGKSSPTEGYDDGESEEAIAQIQTGIDGCQAQMKALTAQMNQTTDATAKAALQLQITSVTNTMATLEMQKQSMLAMLTLNNSMSDMSASISSMSGGISEEDLRGYYLQFEQIEATLIQTAQGMFPTYYQLMYSLEQLNANLAVAETAYQGAQVRQSLGMCTPNEVQEAYYNVTTIKSNITSLENQMVTLKQELCKLIGKDYNTDIVLGELPGIYDAYLNSINFEQDVEAAVSSNYTVCSKQNDMRKYDEDTSDETRAAGKFALAAAREDSRSALSQAYMNIQTQKNERAMALEKWRNAETQMLYTEASYKLGQISRLEYEQQLAGYITDESNYKIAEAKLFDAVNTYQWHMKGL